MRIPGMTQLLSKRPDMFSRNIWPGYYSRAKGANIWDLDGREYLDMSIGGIGACVLGYADEEVDQAVIRAIQDGVACSLNCPEEVRLADVLCKLHPWADMARFTRSGAEALAVAVRIARAHTGREVVACCGYHGWSDWYLAGNLAEDSALDGHLIPGLEPRGVPRGLRGTLYTFQYNRLDEIQAIVAAHGAKLAAIVMEPVRSDLPETDFIEGVRDIADKTGAVLVMDEVSAGFRFCTGGAHMVLHATQPDMAVFSKALGNGYAVSAVIGRKDVMQAAQQTFISSTNWTERVGPTAALACIHAYNNRKPYEKFTLFGQRIKAAWKSMGERNGFTMHVEGMDAMAHFSIEDPDFLTLKAYFVQCMLEEDILASNLCYLMDAHTEADIDRYLAACEKAFVKMAEAREQGCPAQRLMGQPAVAGFKRLA
jgi:glutamate-1-semialdehyde 2,1-aminomutase